MPRMASRRRLRTLLRWQQNADSAIASMKGSRDAQCKRRWRKERWTRRGSKTGGNCCASRNFCSGKWIQKRDTRKKNASNGCTGEFGKRTCTERQKGRVDDDTSAEPGSRETD